MHVILTIAIPTFNRPGNATKRIRELLPELEAGVEIIVIDNCSELEVAKEIRENFPTELPLRVFRHQANLGAGANALRGLELASGDWVWLLGDDDPLESGALRLILNVLRNADRTVGFINFSSGIYQNPAEQLIRNFTDLNSLRLSGPSVSNLLFMSAGIYKREAVMPHLRTGYMMIYSCGPHLALVLEMIQAGKFCMQVRTESVVAWESPDEAQRWSHLKLLAGFPSLFEIDSMSGQSLPIIRTIINQVRWRPFVRQGFCYIFGDTTRPVRYWLSLLTKLFIFGGPALRIRIIPLLISLPIAAVKPLRKWTAGSLGRLPMANSHNGLARM